VCPTTQSYWRRTVYPPPVSLNGCAYWGPVALTAFQIERMAIFPVGSEPSVCSPKYPAVGVPPTSELTNQN
jgi:hypothetical protein